LIERHCSVKAYDTETATTTKGGVTVASTAVTSKNDNNNWEPIRDWLQMRMPSKKKKDRGDDDDDGDDEDSNDNDDDDDDNDENGMILRAAVLEARGRSGQTVLHVACERSVPIDIVEALLSIIDRYKNNMNTSTSTSTSTTNTNIVEYDLPRCTTIDGWLPLHYACNYQNDYDVVRRLVEAYPESKNIQDLKGRTTLHFSMREENMNRPEVVAYIK